MGWSLGSSSKPILTDICGERIDGVFYLNSTPATGTPKEVSCHLRRGTRLLGSVGAAVALPSPGESDGELLSRLRARSDPASADPKAILDGHSLTGSVARSFRRSEVYSIDLEPGNIAELLEPSLVGQSSTRVASYGWWLRIRPLPPGHHELTFSTNPPISGFQEIRFHITVGRKSPRSR